MNIGDKVRFLNDVGGGKITAFRPGGIVMVEDEDGFEVPMPQHEVVVIGEETHSPSLPHHEEGKAAGKRTTLEVEVRKDKEGLTLNGKEYLKSKTVTPVEEKEEVDEQLEARVVRLEQALQSQAQTLQRLEQALQKAEARIALLEAENNLRKNERMMAPKAKPTTKPKPEMPKTIEDLQIL